MSISCCISEVKFTKAINKFKYSQGTGSEAVSVKTCHAAMSCMFNMAAISSAVLRVKLYFRCPGVQLLFFDFHKTNSV